jgi:hypothetical protein
MIGGSSKNPNLIIVIISSYIVLSIFLFIGYKYLEYEHSKKKNKEICENISLVKDPKIRTLIRESCNLDKIE